MPSSAFINFRKLERILEESRENGTDLSLKPEAEASALALVSKRCLENLELGLGRDVEPVHYKEVPGKVVAQLMGHSNVDTTLNVYTQVLGRLSA